MLRQCLVCVIILLLVQYIKAMSDEMKELAAMLHNNCQASSGVADDILDRGMQKEFPDDPKFKCYIHCLLNEMAVIDEKGIIDVEGAVAVLPEEMQDTVAPTIRKCGTKIGADPCDNAFLTYKCYYDNDPVNYFLI